MQDGFLHAHPDVVKPGEIFYWLLDWQVFRSKLPLKLEFTSFTSFVLADALFSTGDTKAVQHNFCVAGMSCALRCFCLFLKLPSTGNLSAAQNFADMRLVCKTEMHFHILSHGFPNKDVYRKKKASANARLGGGKHNVFFKCLYVSKMPANHSID